MFGVGGYIRVRILWWGIPHWWGYGLDHRFDYIFLSDL